MSHLSKIKTSINNFSFLKESLELLNLKHFISPDEKFEGILKVIIPQTRSSIEFVWNGKSYQFATDLSFWKQDLPATEFLEKLSKTYTCLAIRETTRELGFKAVKEEGDIIIVEKWN